MLKKNLCVSNLVRKTKKEYFFDHRKITDNKAFWKNMPSSTNKGINIKNITLAQNGKTLSKRQINSENFNIFSDVVKNLSISEYEDLTVFTSDITDPLLRAKAKYKNHLNCQTNQKYA